MTAAVDDRGAVTIMFAVLAIVMTGASALAIDYARALNARSQMQNALDAAVLAGAKATENSVVQAKAFFDANLPNATMLDVKANFSVANDVVQGAASAASPNFIASLIGADAFAINVSAAAKTRNAGTACVLLVSPDASQALIVNGGADVVFNDCEAHSKSTADPAAVFNAGAALISDRLCLAGDAILDNGGSHPNTETRCLTIDDPFEGTLPAPPTAACDHNNLNIPAGFTALNPGVYCGWTNFNDAPNIVFAPGLYVIKGGGWNVNGGVWRGNGVTFHFADESKIQFNSAVDAILSAPTSGAYEGIAMFEASGLPRNPLVIDDSLGFRLKGLLHLPSRDVVFNGGSQTISHEMTCVFNTLVLNQTRWSLTAGGRLMGGPNSGVTTAVLVH